MGNEVRTSTTFKRLVSFFWGRIRVRKVLSDLEKSIDSVYYQSDSIHYERNLTDFASKLHYLTHCFTDKTKAGTQDVRGVLSTHANTLSKLQNNET